ncbi:hypothetical protein B296_00053238 [Ensete ventricosum]|uniref:Uncharacterized protein n=1 Tax=Ensete ventricosum TaxID=4639 RepID=A0A426Y156_ENSVE|nr:hypothetical protein B296_00053238 [Ensete ventricosum]
MRVLEQFTNIVCNLVQASTAVVQEDTSGAIEPSTEVNRLENKAILASRSSEQPTNSRLLPSEEKFAGKGKQQGKLQFTGLWRLPHTAEEGDAAGWAAVRRAREAATHSRTRREEAKEAALATESAQLTSSLVCSSLKQKREGSKGSVEAESTKPGLLQVRKEKVAQATFWQQHRERKAEREKGAAECQEKQKTTPWSAAPEGMSVAAEDKTMAGNRGGSSVEN